MATSAYDEARAALARGWAPLPLEPGGKRPLVAWSKFQQRRPSASELRYWWRRWPDAGLGLVTGAVSGLVVVDCDSPEARFIGRLRPTTRMFAMP